MNTFLTMFFGFSLIICGCEQIFTPEGESALEVRQPQTDSNKSQTDTVPEGNQSIDGHSDESSKNSGAVEDKSENTPDSKASATNSMPEETNSTQEEDIEPFDTDLDISTMTVINGENQFDTFLDLLENKVRLAKHLVHMEFNPDQNLLHLKSPLALNFSKFAGSKPLQIKTHGNNLIIAGNSFENVNIDTSTPSGSSGHVVVLASGNDFPTINTSGTDGADGIDASCELLKDSCIKIQDRQTRIENWKEDIFWENETIEQILSWDDSVIRPEWKEKITTSVHIPDNDNLKSRVCHTNQYSVLHSSPKVLIRGKLVLRQVIAHAKVQTERSSPSRNSRLFSGTAGENGHNSGNIKIFQLSKKKYQRHWIIPGGKGGKGGLNLKTPPASPTASTSYSSRMISEELDLSQLSVIVGITAKCASEIGRHPQIQYAEITSGFRSNTVPITTQLPLRSRILEFPEQSEGSDLDPLTPTHQPAGLNGNISFGLHQTVPEKLFWNSLWPNVLKRIY